MITNPKESNLTLILINILDFYSDLSLTKSDISIPPLQMLPDFNKHMLTYRQIVVHPFEMGQLAERILRCTAQHATCLGKPPHEDRPWGTHKNSQV